MKNHFYMSYSGNKRLEVENMYNKLDMEDVNDVIEPFCGSCAMSFYISLQQPKRFRYILNDKNNYLREMFEIIRDDERLLDFEIELKDVIEYVKDKKENYCEIVKQKNIMGWFIANRFFSIRAGLYPTDTKTFKFKSLREYPIYNFFVNENIIFTSDNGLDVYSKYKNNSDALILLDPPYINCNNDFYLHKDLNIYEYLYENNIEQEEAKIILILENIWIVKLLFKKNYIVSEYNKLYQGSKKKTSHIIISNKK